MSTIFIVETIASAGVAIYTPPPSSTNTHVLMEGRNVYIYIEGSIMQK